MKKTGMFLLGFSLVSNFSFAAMPDSIPEQKVKRIYPAIQLGGNKTGSWKGETAFLLGLTNRSLKQTKPMTMIMHGPSLGCEMGNYLNAFRIAPKFSYEYYTSFIGTRLSFIDYMDDELHNLYISPEAGMSFGGFFNIYAGASFPLSGNEIQGVNTFRLSVNMNLLFFFFKKD